MINLNWCNILKVSAEFYQISNLIVYFFDFSVKLFNLVTRSVSNVCTLQCIEDVLSVIV
jgi:hypothetical protein